MILKQSPSRNPGLPLKGEAAFQQEKGKQAGEELFRGMELNR